MNKNIIKYWCDLFESNRDNLLCLDIETESFNGNIAIIGLYRPRDGLIECEQFVKGKNLNRNNLIKAFKNCKLVVTFNGKSFDVPKINKEFPGVLQRIKVFDLYLFAKLIGFGSFSLKTFENTFNIERLHPHSDKKGVALKRWRQYLMGDMDAFNKLLEYNKQDSVNLYFLTEKFMEKAKKLLS